jgi:hypothetical protein
MNGQPPLDAKDLENLLQEPLATLKSLAWECKDDSYALLFLLRHLEHLHRQIREEIFQPSLPNTRNALYNLLRDIEESGGWPYIERMKVRALMAHLFSEEEVNPASATDSEC